MKQTGKFCKYCLCSAESYGRTSFVQNRVSWMITYCNVIRALGQSNRSG